MLSRRTSWDLAANALAARLDEARAAGARLLDRGYLAERGAAVPPDRVLLTASTSEAYALLMKVLCGCIALLADGVAVQPVFFYDFERSGHLALSLLPEPPKFAEGLRLVEARLREWPGLSAR